MSKLAENFFMFLLEEHRKTGKNEFILTDYLSFDRYRDAIAELSDRGIITKTNDILGTIVVNCKDGKQP